MHLRLPTLPARSGVRALSGLLTAGALALGAPAAHAAPAPERSVIVQLDAGTSPEKGRALVRAHGGVVTGDLHIIHGLAVRIPARDVAGLRGERGVAHVSADAAVKPQAVDTTNLQSAYPSSVNAPAAWTRPGMTGKGVGVAVIDTGIAGGLPDFKSDTGSSRVVASAVTNPDAKTAADTYGHGTHVAGILAGDGTKRSPADPLDGDYIGIAPGANLVSVKVSDDTGAASVLDVIYGLQFVVDHKADYNIRVVNLSLESEQIGSYLTDPLDAAAESAWLHGIVVVAAAGNRGTAADAVSHAPGNDPFVISVGAVDDQGTKGDTDDTLATWSSRGVTQDGVAKPEINAPGAHIVSTFAPQSAFGTLCPTCLVSGQYFRAGGTSMAAPVVSGVAALLLERFPSLTPNQVKGILVRQARTLPGGFSQVDAAASVRVDPTTVAAANQGVKTNTLVNGATGDIDYTRSSWSRSSWSTASSELTAGWTRSSWSCTCSQTATGDIDPTRSSWSRSSWSTSWSK